MMNKFDTHALEALEFELATPVEVRTARAIRDVEGGRPFNHYLHAARTMVKLGITPQNIRKSYRAIGLTYELVQSALADAVPKV